MGHKRTSAYGPPKADIPGFGECQTPKSLHCATAGSCKFNLRLTAIRKAPSSASKRPCAAAIQRRLWSWNVTLAGFQSSSHDGNCYDLAGEHAQRLEPFRLALRCNRDVCPDAACDDYRCHAIPSHARLRPFRRMSALSKKQTFRIAMPCPLRPESGRSRIY